jgi:hypothetical protein
VCACDVFSNSRLNWCPLGMCMCVCCGKDQTVLKTSRYVCVCVGDVKDGQTMLVALKCMCGMLSRTCVVVKRVWMWSERDARS